MAADSVTRVHAIRVSAIQVVVIRAEAVIRPRVARIAHRAASMTDDPITVSRPASPRETIAARVRLGRKVSVRMTVALEANVAPATIAAMADAIPASQVGRTAAVAPRGLRPQLAAKCRT